MQHNTPGTPTDPTGDKVQDKVQEKSQEKVQERSQEKVRPPVRPTGPNASAIIAGLVAIILAALVIARETLNLHVDWSRTGPGTIVGLGVVLVVIGAVGLIRRRSDHET